MKLTPRERFLAKVCPEPNGGCWLWRGQVRPDGYGTACFESRRYAAHRLSWFLFRSEIAPGLVVCHKCDVRTCVNPDHLFLGTPADNARDRVKKNRSPRGEKSAQAKLTDEKVRIIKTMLAQGRLYLSEIAKEFGVAEGTVKAIRNGQTWRHVAGPQPDVETTTDPVEQPDQEPIVMASPEDEL